MDALLEWEKRPGWTWERMRDHVNNRPHIVWGLCYRSGSRQDQQNCSAKPDPNADPQNQFIPFPHTDFPGSGDNQYILLISSVFRFNTPTVLCDFCSFDSLHGFQASHWPGHSSLDIFQLANSLFTLCITQNLKVFQIRFPFKKNVIILKKGLHF